MFQEERRTIGAMALRRKIATLFRRLMQDKIEISFRRHATIAARSLLHDIAQATYNERIELLSPFH